MLVRLLGVQLNAKQEHSLQYLGAQASYLPESSLSKASSSASL